jgi:2-oxoglutarate dehydrogenase E2 component (dihydrolipoamide succinyltransferase)
MSTLFLKVPALGESVTEVMIGKWRRAEGEQIALDEPLVEIESDKATVDIPAPGAGVLRRILRQQGETVAVGAVLAEIEAGVAVEASPASAPAPVAAAAAPAPGNGASAANGGGVKASPALRRLMAEHEIAASQVKASGPGGRIVRDDVLRATGVAHQQPVASPVPLPSSGPAGVLKDARERIVPMTPLRKTVARRLLEAQRNAAILTTFNEINMHEVMGLRERYQEQFLKRHGIKLGFMSFFVKAAVDALKAFPLVNAEVRGTDVVYKDFYDIGIAVGGGKGLVVPVLRSADRLTLAEVEKGIGALAVKARDNKLLPQDLEGGTFTISNGGVYGSMMSTPILNPPQSGILGLHAIQKRPVAVGEAIALRPMMYVALSYDHRIVDGREAVQFLVRIKECIEDPERILIEV